MTFYARDPLEQNCVSFRSDRQTTVQSISNVGIHVSLLAYGKLVCHALLKYNYVNRLYISNYFSALSNSSNNK